MPIPYCLPISGIPELVRPGEYGWLVMPGDQDALVDALEQLSNASLDTLNAMGERAQQQVRA